MKILICYYQLKQVLTVLIDRDNFSSFSDTSAVAVPSERKELEDGEIDVGGTNSKGKSKGQPSNKLTSPAAASSIRRRSR